MNPVAEKLREARKLIERGWTQGDWRRDGSRCALSALHAACVPQDGDNLVRLVTGWNSIIDWNDAPGRTKAEVLAAFDKAIALAESGQ